MADIGIFNYMFQNSQDFHSAFCFLERQKQSTLTFIEQLTNVVSVNVLTFHSFPYDETHSCYQQCDQTNSSIDVPRNSCDKADKTNLKHFCMLMFEKLFTPFNSHDTQVNNVSCQNHTIISNVTSYVSYRIGK